MDKEYLSRSKSLLVKKGLFHFTQLQKIALLIWGFIHTVLLIMDWNHFSDASNYFWPFQRDLLSRKIYDFSEYILYVGGLAVAMILFNFIKESSKKTSL